MELINKRELRKHSMLVFDAYSDLCDNQDSAPFEAVSVKQIENAPEIDPIHAAGACYCEECKHYKNYPNGLCYKNTEPCTNPRGYKGEAVCVEKTDFCSYGERKENSLPTQADREAGKDGV